MSLKVRLVFKCSLPDTSTDLLIKDGRHLMRSLSIYEVLRRFHHILRLTPFRYEDFAAALLSDEQSPLFAEIHIHLLKTLLREDKNQQTWLGPQDIRDSINIYLYSTDHICWLAALRVYLTADPYANADLIDALSPKGIKNYPFNVGLSTRLDILEELCEKFLLSVLARDDIVNGNQQLTKQDTQCRMCSKSNGEFIYCSTCPAIFHIQCYNPGADNLPSLDGDKPFLCTLCKANHIKGVSDCILPDEKNGILKRHEPVGIDKASRTYWFIARRVFVVDEKEEDVRYYSTVEQLGSLLECLKECKHEKALLASLSELREEIERQMKITDELYSFRRDKLTLNGNQNEFLSEDETHKNYINHYWSTSATSGKNQHPDRDVIRTLSNKFSLYSITTFRWNGNTDGHMSILTATIKSTILRLEASIPQTFIHHCWPAQKQSWIKSVNNSQKPVELTKLLTFLESGIKPVLFRSYWQEGIGFTQLLRSTSFEREELKKTDKQARGFERRECVSQDFELAHRMGTTVKFSARLKPVKHQVWKQKGEEYRLTGLNGWYWRSKTHLSRLRLEPKLMRIEPHEYTSSTTLHPFMVDMSNEIMASSDVIDVAKNLSCDEYARYLYPKKPSFEKHRLNRIKKLESLLATKQDQIKKSQVSQQDPTVIDKNSNGSISNSSPGPVAINNGQLAQAECVRSQTSSLSASKNGNVSLQGSIDTKSNIVINASSPSPAKVNFIANSASIPATFPKRCVFAKPKLPPTHNFLTKRGKIRSLLVLPNLELHKLARSGGLREAKSFSYSAKPSQYIWPYGITPRPTFRTCWLYRNCQVDSYQDVALQLKVMHSSIRWEDLQTKPPASGQNVITTDDSIITVELLKKRDRLPYLTHSEYLIRKVTKPIEQPTKYRRVSSKSTPSARVGLRARRSIEEDDHKGPTTEEKWVSEDQLDLWELRQFDEKIERHNQLIRERAMREEAERRRKLEEERRRKADLERRRLRAEEDMARRTKSYTRSVENSDSNPTTPKPVSINIPNNSQINKQQVRPQQTSSPVVRYLRTEQGQIIRLPASYLERGTPLILRQVGPGGNQTNTYIIRPQVVSCPTGAPQLRMVTPVTATTISNPATLPTTIKVEEKKEVPVATPNKPTVSLGITPAPTNPLSTPLVTMTTTASPLVTSKPTLINTTSTIHVVSNSTGSSQVTQNLSTSTSTTASSVEDQANSKQTTTALVNPATVTSTPLSTEQAVTSPAQTTAPADAFIPLVSPKTSTIANVVENSSASDKTTGMATIVTSDSKVEQGSSIAVLSNGVASSTDTPIDSCTNDKSNNLTSESTMNGLDGTSTVI